MNKHLKFSCISTIPVNIRIFILQQVQNTSPNSRTCSCKSHMCIDAIWNVLSLKTRESWSYQQVSCSQLSNTHHHPLNAARRSIADSRRSPLSSVCSQQAGRGIDLRKICVQQPWNHLRLRIIKAARSVTKTELSHDLYVPCQVKDAPVWYQPICFDAGAHNIKFQRYTGLKIDCVLSWQSRGAAKAQTGKRGSTVVTSKARALHKSQQSPNIYQLFPEPDTSVMSCLWSKTSLNGPFSISLTTPSSISTKTAWNKATQEL